MNAGLRHRIERARMTLSGDPDGIVSGEVPPGSSVSSPYVDERCPTFAEFLRACDGGRFGSVDIWSHAHIEGMQFIAEHLPGGRASWLIIGQVLYEPIACDARGNTIRFVRDDGGELGELGLFDSFITKLFGAEYADIVASGEMDPWWHMLAVAGLR